MRKSTFKIDSDIVVDSVSLKLLYNDQVAKPDSYELSLFSCICSEFLGDKNKNRKSQGNDNNKPILRMDMSFGYVKSGRKSESSFDLFSTHAEALSPILSALDPENNVSEPESSYVFTFTSASIDKKSSKSMNSGVVWFVDKIMLKQDKEYEASVNACLDYYRKAKGLIVQSWDVSESLQMYELRINSKIDAKLQSTLLGSVEGHKTRQEILLRCLGSTRDVRVKSNVYLTNVLIHGGDAFIPILVPCSGANQDVLSTPSCSVALRLAEHRCLECEVVTDPEYEPLRYTEQQQDLMILLEANSEKEILFTIFTWWIMATFLETQTRYVRPRSVEETLRPEHKTSTFSAALLPSFHDVVSIIKEAHKVDGGGAKHRSIAEKVLFACKHPYKFPTQSLFVRNIDDFCNGVVAQKKKPIEAFSFHKLYTSFWDNWYEKHRLDAKQPHILTRTIKSRRQVFPGATRSDKAAAAAASASSDAEIQYMELATVPWLPPKTLDPKRLFDSDDDDDDDNDEDVYEEAEPKHKPQESILLATRKENGEWTFCQITDTDTFREVESNIKMSESRENHALTFAGKQVAFKSVLFF